MSRAEDASLQGRPELGPLLSRPALQGEARMSSACRGSWGTPPACLSEEGLKPSPYCQLIRRAWKDSHRPPHRQPVCLTKDV